MQVEKFKDSVIKCVEKLQESKDIIAGSIDGIFMSDGPKNKKEYNAIQSLIEDVAAQVSDYEEDLDELHAIFKEKYLFEKKLNKADKVIYNWLKNDIDIDTTDSIEDIQKCANATLPSLNLVQLRQALAKELNVVIMDDYQ